MLSAEGPQTTFLKHLTLAARARLVKLQLESRWRRAGEGRRLPAGQWGRPQNEASQQCEFLGPMGDAAAGGASFRSI